MGGRAPSRRSTRFAASMPSLMAVTVAAPSSVARSSIAVTMPATTYSHATCPPLDDTGDAREGPDTRWISVDETPPAAPNPAVVKTLGRVASGSIMVALLAAPAGAQPPPATAKPPVLVPPASAGAPAAAPATPAPSPAPATPAWKAPSSRLPKLPPPPPPPDTPARLWIIAPGPREPWTMRIDNEGDKAIRIPADVRLLAFEIDVPSNDPKNPKKKPTTYKCSAPDSMRPSGFPERRALLLAPGQSYIETFDPHLFCFGKSAAALVGTAIVRARFGWEPPPKWSLAAKKAPTGPFAAEGTDNPATTTPLRQLRAPTLVLSFGTPQPATPGAQPATPAVQPATPAAQPASPTAQPAPPTTQPTSPADQPAAPGAQPVTPAAQAAAPPVDANAPRLGVEAPAFVDASAPRSASITVTIKNAGGRPMLAALRPRMLSFEVIGPDRTATCPAGPPTHAIPREGYREYKPGSSTSFTVLLEEACGGNLFSRPGLYRVNAGIEAKESGAELDLDAFTGKATTREPALLRLQTARDPFYRDPPKPVPTPGTTVPPDEAEQAP